ncbi:RHO GDP-DISSOCIATION INHIBITOR 1-LIKE [Salix purpurea]|uniref:RHO GDP-DISSOCIATION INHIBITOR 1-LIKE n=1 Tax=Salix purpurea TaxID=77065 RepID=A0A9Q0VXA5_SALPP|nr:RHO GDP-DISSOCIATION INHIBITOR 1-LIKE [Salix purpurea]
MSQSEFPLEGVKEEVPHVLESRETHTGADTSAVSFVTVDGLLISLEVGVDSNTKTMGFDEKNKEEVSETAATTKTPPNEEHNVDESKSGGISRKMSESSLYGTDQEEEDDEETNERKIELGPQYTLKEQLEKDKDDESLRRWKEQLLGAVDIESAGETLEPEVKILSLEIKSAGRPDIVLSVPENGKPKGSWFTLKEGSRYSLQFTFKVKNNIVSGLKYTNTVWKTGVRVDSSKEMIGTFSPQAEPYTHEMPEETTPSGMFARGSYAARSKFVDDDNKCYLEINYYFDIRKEWLPSKN